MSGYPGGQRKGPAGGQEPGLHPPPPLLTAHPHSPRPARAGHSLGPPRSGAQGLCHRALELLLYRTSVPWPRLPPPPSSASAPWAGGFSA